MPWLKIDDPTNGVERPSRVVDEFRLLVEGSQALLDYVAAQHAGIGAGHDGEADFGEDGALDICTLAADSASGKAFRGTGSPLEVFRQHVIDSDVHWPEGWYGVELHRRFDVAPAVDNQGHIVRHMSAVIDCSQTDELPYLVFIDLEEPVEAHLIHGRREGTLSDRVRFASYLVALYSDAIRLVGFDEAVRGRLARNLSMCVRLLRELIGTPGTHDTNDRDDKRENGND